MKGRGHDPLANKLDTLLGTINVADGVFNDRNVLLLDDLYQSGVSHHASDPALRFLSLLHTALASTRAHLAERRGGVPESHALAPSADTNS